MMHSNEAPEPDDPERILPEPLKAWEPAGPHKRLPVPTKRPANFRDPDAPHINTRRRRLAVVKAALEAVVTSDKADPHDRMNARKLLYDLNCIERERPDTTAVGMVPAGACCMTIWVFEPDLAAGRQDARAHAQAERRDQPGVSHSTLDVSPRSSPCPRSLRSAAWRTGGFFHARGRPAPTIPTSTERLHEHRASATFRSYR